MNRTVEARNKVWIGSALSAAMLFSVAATGCKSAPPATTAAVDMNNGVDPAAANMADGSAAPESAQPAPAQPTARVLGQRNENQNYTQQGEAYPQQAAPIERRDPTTFANDDSQYTTDVDTSQPAVYADQPPPPLPVYDQPEAPSPDDLWTPGYWNYGTGGFYWVPGAWVGAPYAGALWTPPYWGYNGGRYGFHHGYWGLHIGFYGGIPYGFGYTGFGYEGGYWNHDHFYYNQSVNRVNVNVIHNTYIRNVTVVNNVHISYNGGPGGLNVRPRPQELVAIHEQHTAPMPAQIQHQQQAAQNRQQFFAENHGRPATVVAPRTLPAEHVAPPTRNIAPSARPNPQQEPVRGGFGQQQAQPGRPAEPQRGPEPQTMPHNIQQPNQRIEPQQPQQQRVEPQQRQNVPQQRQNVPEQRQNVQPPPPQQVRPQPQAQPQRQPEARPQAQPQAQPQRVEPQARPAEQPRPEPQARPAEQQAQPRPQAPPQPQAKPQPQPQSQPHPQAHPAEPAKEERR